MKYKGMEGVLFQLIVEYMKDHDAKDLLVLVTDAMEKANEIRNILNRTGEGKMTANEYIKSIQDNFNVIDKNLKEIEEWNGIHGQVTAPKGTFDRIYNECQEDDDV